VWCGGWDGGVGSGSVVWRMGVWELVVWCGGWECGKW
jgi:hypothetical protein